MKLKVLSEDGLRFYEENFNIGRDFLKKKYKQIIKNVIVVFQNNKRHYSAYTKDRSEVEGSGKKPWKQKGTGNARHGERSSPIWVKGGVVHGPKAIKKRMKLNKKEKRIAFKMALLEKIENKEIYLIENLKRKKISTKGLNILLKKIKLQSKILLIDKNLRKNKEIILSVRNLQKIDLNDSKRFNTLDILRSKKILCSKNAFIEILDRINLN